MIPFKDVYENLGGSIRCSTLPIIRANAAGIRNTFAVVNEVDPLLVCMVGKLTPDKKNSEICQAAVKDVGKPVGRAKMLRMIGVQLEGLVAALQAHGVTVLRPDEIALERVTACNAIFARDGLLVIGQDVLNSNLHLPHRRDEHIAYMDSIRSYFAGIGAIGGASKSKSISKSKSKRKSKGKGKGKSKSKRKTRKL